MKYIFTLILSLGVLCVSAQTHDSLQFDTMAVSLVAPHITPSSTFSSKSIKPVSSFSTESIKKSKIERRALRNAQSRFVPSDKYIGANVSFGTEELDDELLLSIVELPKFRRNVFAMSVVFGYFTSPTSAWGARLMYNYGYNHATLQTDFLGILEPRQYIYNTLMHRAEAYGFHRLYVPLGDKGKNFYFFNEISVHYGYQRSETVTGTNDSDGNELKRNRAYNTVHRFGLGLAPGLTYFSGNRMALEFQLGTSGAEIALRNVVSDKGRNSTSVGFQFRDFMSILRIKMGLTFYFN